jgi:hypothetical protein
VTLPAQKGRADGCRPLPTAQRQRLPSAHAHAPALLQHGVPKTQVAHDAATHPLAPLLLVEPPDDDPPLDDEGAVSSGASSGPVSSGASKPESSDGGGPVSSSPPEVPLLLGPPLLFPPPLPLPLPPPPDPELGVTLMTAPSLLTSSSPPSPGPAVAQATIAPTTNERKPPAAARPYQRILPVYMLNPLAQRQHGRSTACGDAHGTSPTAASHAGAASPP